jgi:ribosomal protein S18 acetylase RimI-like enzyme
VKLRAYVASDWPALCAIHDLARLDELRHSAGLAAFLSLQQTAQSEGLFDGALVVAEDADDGAEDAEPILGPVVGFVAFTADALTWLYVAPSHYRRGIGRALLRHAIDHAGDVFGTEVLDGNDPALALYLSEGFVVIEHRRGKLEGNEAFAAAGLILERRR